MKKQLTVIGSGLTGPLLSLILSSKHGCNIEMYERSSDSRKKKQFSGRSINLALSKRGIKSLEYAGIFNDKFKSLLIPMYGRTIHSIDGNVSFQAYGNKKDHYINSVSRQSINNILIESAEKTGKVEIHFDMKCQNLDLVNKKLNVNGDSVDIKSPIIGADGYRSIVSSHIASLYKNKLNYINIEHSYKELTIKAKNNEFQMEPNSLHIWPRRDMMMIALPNIDRSFTCTLFMKSKGKNSFKSIADKNALLNFFEDNFCDVISLLDNLEYDFFNNPTGRLLGLRSPKWNYEGQALSIGDAAHATVPFYGQGMNASFEDCYILSQVIGEKSNFDWEDIFNEFYNIRKEDADAILDLSLENYTVMRNDVLNKSHVDRQKLSFMLNNDYPDQFIPLYTMVSFTTIPYKQAHNRGKIQNKILDKLLENNKTSIENYDKQKARELINEQLTKICC